jgi:glutaredoxin-like protein NrdH
VTVDLATDKNSVNLVTQLGYRSAPVVIGAREHWSGFRPDKISSTATATRQAPASTTKVDA